MAKSSLGQVFIKSLVRQVGRDAGKVVSNKAFKDAHVTPIRMVQSADTSAQYAGKRRTYRHDLDRVVNGDLPSTAGTAKKNLVKLENALEDFLNGMMPIGNAEDITIMKNWIDKSLDYIGDVLKIVDKPDVKALADDLVKTIEGIKTQTKEKVGQMEVPVDESIPKKKRNARVVFWLGMALMFLPGAFIDSPADVPSKAADTEVVMDDSAIEAEAELTQAEAAEDSDILSGAGSVIALGFWTMLVGAFMLNRSKRRRKAHENVVENTSGMKAAVASW